MFVSFKPVKRPQKLLYKNTVLLEFTELRNFVNDIVYHRLAYLFWF